MMHARWAMPPGDLEGELHADPGKQYIGRRLVRLGHGAIFSKMGAFAEPAAVHEGKIGDASSAPAMSRHLASVPTDLGRNTVRCRRRIESRLRYTPRP
jgi:hypothetical protein